MKIIQKNNKNKDLNNIKNTFIVNFNLIQKPLI